MNLTPEAASESTWGVGMSLQPWNPRSAYPRSSATMKRMFGFFGAAADIVEDNARIADTEQRKIFMVEEWWLKWSGINQYEITDREPFRQVDGKRSIK